MPAISVRKWWHRGSQSSLVVEMGITSNGAGHAQNVIGTWDAANSAYYFDFPDNSITIQFNPAVKYSIWDNASEVLSEIELGGSAPMDALNTHTADTTAHGATGANVGTTNVQTLTNKTISGADNTLTVKPSQILSSADSALLGQKIKPGGDDTVLHADVSSATVIELQAANNAKSADRVLRIIAGSVDLQTDGGANIKITGLAAGTATGDAARYDEVAAIDTRVGALEQGGTWIGTPTISMSLSSRQRWTVDIAVRADATNNGKVARWEVFWSPGSLGGLAAGSRSSAEIDQLRLIGSRIVLPGESGHRVSINYDEPVNVISVAFDSTGSAYSSAEASITPAQGGVQRTEAGTVVEFPITPGGSMTIAGTADGNEAAVLSTWVQTGTTFKTKARQPYVHNSGVKKLRLHYRGRNDTAAHVGYIRLAVVASDGTTIVKSTQFAMPYTSAVPTTPSILELDVSSGLTAGTLYTLTVAIAADDAGADEAELTSDIYIEPIQQVLVF